MMYVFCAAIDIDTGLSSSIISTAKEVLSDSVTPPATPREVGALSPVPSDTTIVLSAVSLFDLAVNANVADWAPFENTTVEYAPPDVRFTPLSSPRSLTVQCSRASPPVTSNGTFTVSPFSRARLRLIVNFVFPLPSRTDVFCAVRCTDTPFLSSSFRTSTDLVLPESNTVYPSPFSNLNVSVPSCPSAASLLIIGTVMLRVPLAGIVTVLGPSSSGDTKLPV